MWKQYHTVSSIQETLDLLKTHGPRARIIAGGTDILIELERKQRPDVDILIDISRIPELDTITLQADRFHIGPLVTHNHIVDHPLILAQARPLAMACWEVGAPQIRNRATIVGNIVTGSPANDTITPLLALDASVHLASTTAKRIIPLRDFYTGLRQPVIRPDEMVTEVSFSALSAQSRGTFIKLGLRAAQAISVINVAVVLHFAEDDQTIQDAKITLGSVAPTVIHAPEAEASLIGQTLTPETITIAAQQAAGTPSPIDDVRSTAEYRTEMLRVMVARALRALAVGQPEPSWHQPAAMLWGKAQGRAITNGSYTHDDTRPIETTINGQHRTILTGQHKTLLRFLREDANLTGTKEGCAEGECGACTVFLDGAAVMACMVPAPRAQDAEIITVEGLQHGDQLHPIQQAFIEEGAVQCGYCTPGLLMSGAKLLEEHPQPTRDQIMQSISGNLCRCTGYYKVIDAISKSLEE
jgi:xanthine dehydrogenase iron-sulfur cluster and FAD-binding subunit A